MSVVSDSGRVLGNGIRVSLRYILVAGGIGAGLGLLLTRRRDRYVHLRFAEVPTDDVCTVYGRPESLEPRNASSSSDHTGSEQGDIKRESTVHRLTNIYFLRKNKRAGRGAASII